MCLPAVLSRILRHSRTSALDITDRRSRLVESAAACPMAPITQRRRPLSSRRRPSPSLHTGSPIRPRCALRRVTWIRRPPRFPCGSALRPPCRTSPQPLRTHAGRAALGIFPRALAAAGAQVVLPACCLPTPDLHRTAAHCGRALGPAYPAARPAPGRPRSGARGQGWRASAPRLGRRGAPAHPAARATRHPVPALPTPTGLGSDDFALRKGQTSGTVRIDLERWQPVVLLPDRPAATLAPWLQAHLGVQVIARARATACADGARHGAPAATQVADRLPLLRHLAEAVEQVFHQHRRV